MPRPCQKSPYQYLDVVGKIPLFTHSNLQFSYAVSSSLQKVGRFSAKFGPPMYSQTWNVGSGPRWLFVIGLLPPSALNLNGDT